MGIIIDTSVIIAAEKGKINFNKWQEYDEVYISAVTVSELLVGVERANTEERRVKRSAFVEHIIESITSLSFDREEARIYARILSTLFTENITVGTHDLIIAATAISHDYSVLTLNAKDFQKIKGLNVLQTHRI